MTSSAPAPPTARSYRYYDFLVGGFVAVLLCSNLIGASKAVQIGGLTVGAGILFFPLSYVFGDVLTEVYGYAQSRRAVWSGFSALLLASLMAWIVVKVPPAPGWDGQHEVERIFGQTPRIALASITAYFMGEFVNSYVLAKLKVWSQGRKLWMRTIGSTIAGEGVDSLVFYPLAFAGVWSNDLLISVMTTNYVLKVVWEIVLTPVTYRAVAFLKRAENEDYYDYNTDFSPFHMK